MNKNTATILTFTLLAFAIILSSHFAVAFASPATVNLGNSANYIILAKTAITTTGITSITGDIGISPALSTDTSGFGQILDGSGTFSTSSLITGKIYAADYTTPTPDTLTTAISNMQTAYTNALGRAADQTNPGSAGEIGGLVLYPGVYTFTGGSVNVHISTDLVLSGNSNDVWIFQIPGTFDIANSKQVILTGGAQAKNVFWVVTGATTIFPSSTLEGNILDKTSIAIQNDATLNGRALAQTAVTLIANTVLLPVVTLGSINYTILLNSTQNSSVTTNRGNITIDGTSSNLPNNTTLLNITHSILFTPSVGFAFLRWNATGGIIITNNLTNLTTAKINGNGTLTAVYYNTSMPAVLTTITLSQQSLNLTIGTSQQLNVQLLDQFGNPSTATVNYTTSNSFVATVNSTGSVSAISLGNVTITASNGSINGTINITVNSLPTTNSDNSGSSSGSGGGHGGGSCSTNWTCTSWSSCTNKVQTRSCSYPTSWCVPTEAKPAQSQLCTTTTSGNATEKTPVVTNSNVRNGITGAITGATGTGIPLNPTGIVLMSLVGIGTIGTFVFKRFSKK